MTDVETRIVKVLTGYVAQVRTGSGWCGIQPKHQEGGIFARGGPVIGAADYDPWGKPEYQLKHCVVATEAEAEFVRLSYITRLCDHAALRNGNDT